MNIPFLACIIVIADYVDLDGSPLGLQSQQVGLKWCDSEDKPEVNPKEMEPQTFGRTSVCMGGLRDGGCW